MASASKPPARVEPLYFDLQSDFGITKHMGGRKATDELIQMCHLQAGESILEVGCGIGGTTCYLADEYDLQVTAVDILPRMVQRSRERAKRRGLADRVEFKVADAQQLPFEKARFDAVIDESVAAFVQDKQRGLAEYARVTKPGGYVGLNEVTWIKPPPPDLVRYAALIMAGADFLTAAGWQALLEGARLTDLAVRQGRFHARSQFAEELRQLDIREQVRAWYRFLTQSVSNPAYREFTREVMSAPGQIFKFIKHIGYGIYVGRKPI
jgi:ubiquinone/menaquinone biosynthesis C-methylase UbiE